MAMMDVGVTMGCGGHGAHRQWGMGVAMGCWGAMMDVGVTMGCGGNDGVWGS